jgi:hypothetical protein
VDYATEVIEELEQLLEDSLSSEDSDRPPLHQPDRSLLFTLLCSLHKVTQIKPEKLLIWVRLG